MGGAYEGPEVGLVRSPRLRGVLSRGPAERIRVLLFLSVPVPVLALERAGTPRVLDVPGLHARKLRRALGVDRVRVLLALGAGARRARVRSGARHRAHDRDVPRPVAPDADRDDRRLVPLDVPARTAS